MNFKKCISCLKNKTLNDFPLRSSSKDGRRNSCYECTNTFKRNWNLSNKEKIKIYNERYLLNNFDHVKKLQKETNKRYKKRNTKVLKEKYKLWYLNNKDKSKLATEQWHIKNPDWKLKYYEENKLKIKEKQKQWAKLNAGKVRAKTRKYQAAKKNATPLWLSSIHIAQIQEFYDVAVALEMQNGIKYHVDHIVPLQGKNVCGLHVPWNLQILQSKENIAKNNKFVGD